MNLKYLDTLSEVENKYGVALGMDEKAIFTAKLSVFGTETDCVLGTGSNFTLTNKRIIVDNGVWTVDLSNDVANCTKVKKGRLFFKRVYYSVSLNTEIVFDAGKQQLAGFHFYFEKNEAGKFGGIMNNLFILNGFRNLDVNPKYTLPLPLSKEEAATLGKNWGTEYWDVPDGFTMAYSKTRVEIIYLGGVPYTGMAYTLYGDGSLKSYNKLTGGWIEETYSFYPDGSIEKYYLQKDGNYPGFRYKYHTNGQLKEYSESQYFLNTYIVIYDETGRLLGKAEEPTDAVRNFLQYIEDVSNKPS